MYAITLLINQHDLLYLMCVEQSLGESFEEEKTALDLCMAEDSIMEPTRPPGSERRKVSATTVQGPKPIKKIRF